MTLRLINAYTSQNLGDAAIYETLVQLAGPLGASTALPEERVRLVRGLQRAEAPGSVWVSVGGDIFNNARPRLVTRRFLELVQELGSRDPERTFVFGQGLPSSCRGLALGWLARSMKRLSSVTVRDVESRDRLRAAGVQAELGFDTVFAYQTGAGAADAGNALWQQAGVDPEKAVLFSVREFDRMYPHDGALFEDRMARLLELLRQRGHQPALLVHAQAEGADSDMAVLDRLRTRLGALPVLDPFSVASQGHHPLDALAGVLQQSAGVLAVRYHTAVLRLLAGRVPYSLFYSSKGRDLVSRLGLPGQSLGDFDPADIVPQIEATMAQSFDVRHAAITVRQQFREAMAWAQAAG